MLTRILHHWRLWRSNRLIRQDKRDRLNATLLAVHINSASAVSQRRLK